jgi:hypothetical protein
MGTITSRDRQSSLVHGSRAGKGEDSLMPGGGSSREGGDTAFAEDRGVDEKNPFNVPSSGGLGTHDAGLTVIDNSPVDQWSLGRSPSKIAHRRLGIPNVAEVRAVCGFLRKK